MEILSEITPLSEKDCIYVVERTKTAFSYPLHQHQAIELNFLEHAEGARRLVGDSMERVGIYDLTLIGSNLMHEWKQDECRMDNVHEITIQIPADLLSGELLSRNDFASIAALLHRAQNGISFGQTAIRKVYDNLYMLARMQPGFHSFLKVLSILYDLSITTDFHILSTSAFSHRAIDSDNERIQRVTQYIEAHYRGSITLEQLSRLADMTPTSFSRFFSAHTGRTLSDYITSVRIGHAAHLLLTSDMGVAEICYDCGFNTISHFNRSFKKQKGCSPSLFRENYHSKETNRQVSPEG